MSVENQEASTVRRREWFLDGRALECWVHRLIPPLLRRRLETFVDSFIPDVIWEAGPVEVRRARTLVGSIFAGCGVGLISTPANFLWGSEPAGWMAIFIIASVLTLPKLLQRTGNLTLVTSLLLGLVFIPITTSIYLQGGWASPAFRWFVAVPLLATFFGGRRVGIVFAGVALAVSGIFYGVDLAGYEMTPRIPVERMQGLHMITATALLAMVAIVSFTVEKTKEMAFLALEQEIETREEAVRSLRSSERKLAQAHCIAHIGCWEYDLIENDVWWSEEHYRLHGMEPQRGKFDPAVTFALIVEEDREAVLRVSREAMLRKEPYRAEYAVTLPGGVIRHHASAGEYEYDDEGEPLRLIGTTQDITERRIAEEQMASMHKRLLKASHKAGMAEVATGVLHNMGNVLTSLNTSVSVMEETLKSFKVEGLSKARTLIDEHAGDLARFFVEDQRGQRFPAYFGSLSEHLNERHQDLFGQLKDIKRSLAHINMIIGSQQSYASSGGLVEEVLLSEVVEEALRINTASTELGRIQFRTAFADSPKVTTDRHRLLQILVSLVKNAVDAVAVLDESEEGCSITIRIAKADSNQVAIEVIDSGVGISDEDLTRIFAFGFTTKKDGHGFGLHNAALAAEVLGGSLSVTSEGPGRGATFQLRLPMQIPVA